MASYEDNDIHGYSGRFVPYGIRYTIPRFNRNLWTTYVSKMRFVSNNRFNTFRDNIMYENPF